MLRLTQEENMTEVIDLADTYEGAEVRLAHLTEQASTGREHLGERLTQGQARRAALGTTREAVLEHMTSLERLLQETPDHLAGDHLNAVTSLTHVEAATGEQGTLLPQAGQQWHNAQAELQTAVQSVQDTLQTGLEAARAEFAQGASAATELEQQLHASKEGTRTVFQALEQQLDHLQQQTGTLQADTEATIGRVGVHLTELQTTQVAALFEAMHDQLSQQQRLVLTDHFTSSGEAFAAAWQGFTTQATLSANELTQRATDMLHGLEQHCADKLQSELQHVVHQVIEAAVRELLREIGLSAVIMQTGANVTAAMSPILPELKLAKESIHLINEAFDAMEKLTGGLLG
jgi:glutathione S-transferase